jgi:ribonuclease P/MRP protein subunit POP5
MKKIMPSLREKNRYIVYKISSSSKIAQKKAENALYDGIVRFLGEFKAAEASVRLIDWNNQKGIIKTNSKFKDKIISAMILMSKIGETNVNINTIGVSGTIKKARNKFMMN